MRRHLIGLGLGVVMLIEMFFGGAWGYLRLLRLPVAASAPTSALPAQGGSLLSSTGVITAMGAVVATGLIAGVLIAWPRVSPLAAGIPGLVALAWTGLYLGDVKEAADLIPLRAHAFGAGWEALLFNGILGLFGVAMIIPMCVPARWRNPYATDDEAIEADVTDARGFVADLKANVGADSVSSAGSTGLVGAAAMAGSAGSPRRGPTDPAQTRMTAAGGRPGSRRVGRHGSSAGRQGQSSGRPTTSESQAGVLTGRPIPPSGQRMTGEQQRLTGGQQRLTGEQQRLTGEQQRLTGGQMRVTGSQTRLTGGQPPIPGGQQRTTGAQQRTTGAQPRTTGAQPRMTGGQQRLTGEQQRLGGQQQWPTGAQARVTGGQRAMADGNPMMSGAELSAQLRSTSNQRLSGSQPWLPDEQ
jgi:hypothetical protein